MAIFRGVGGSGDSSDNSFLDAVTAQASAASASASAASASASSILNLTASTGAEGTEASYNASTGVLTIPKGDTGDVSDLTSSDITSLLTGGSGISIASDGTITNASPDETVALTGAGGTSVTGTYPNFTITSSSTLTNYQIKIAYENNANTNAFTDAEKTKLSAIEANATADQTGSEIKSAYEAVADTNAFTDAEKTKLSGIEASADVTDATNVTAAGAVMDGDFTSNGFMKRTGAGAYSVDTSTYLTSFDITTQTDPKYLRADTGDSAAGFIQFVSGFNSAMGTFTGALSGTTASFTGDVQADTFDGDNLDISKTGSVTTNISTGYYSSSSDVKTINIGTGFHNGGTTTINIAPASTTTTKNINLNGNVTVSSNNTLEATTIDVTTIDLSGQLDAVVTSPAVNTPILDLQKYSASSNGTGRFITLSSRSSQSGASVLRGMIGLSNQSSPQYSNPYMSHISGSNGIACSYSSSSSYNAIVPCASTGIATNGSLQLGHAYAKWNTVYASSGSINTSDITKKQDIEELSEAENRVAIAAKGLLRKYRWKDSVSEKGDNARIHFGIMAQDLKAAFEAEGLDASRYGMFCADTRWTTDGTDTYATEEEALEAIAEEETPEAITEETVYGVRYEELLAFIIAAI
jgi:hypothetical protein